MPAKHIAERTCTVHKLIADVAIFASDRVLLVKYKDVARYDGQRGWFLPDDFMAFGEHPDVAVRRIARDQVGVSLPNARLAHVESFGDGAWHLTFHYRAELTGSPRIAPGLNVRTADWFPLTGLPDRSDVAHHGWAIDVLEVMARSAGA